MHANFNTYWILCRFCFVTGLPNYAFIKPSLNVVIYCMHIILELQGLNQPKLIYFCNNLCKTEYGQRKKAITCSSFHEMNYAA
jgi:hypothetical protein